MYYSLLKHKSWEYEKEIRLVINLPADYTDAIPSAIYIGAKCENFNEFTKKNGYELYKLYADEGISGKQIKHRKQFQQMMIDAKAKKIDNLMK